MLTWIKDVLFVLLILVLSYFFTSSRVIKMHDPATVVSGFFWKHFEFVIVMLKLLENFNFISIEHGQWNDTIPIVTAVCC